MSGKGGAAYEFTASGKTLKIVFDVPRRTTRNDIIFHASDKILIAGLRVRRKNIKRKKKKKKEKNKNKKKKKKKLNSFGFGF
jgi:hypothetical protein